MAKTATVLVGGVLAVVAVVVVVANETRCH